MEQGSWKNAWKSVKEGSVEVETSMVGIRRKSAIDRRGSALSDRVGPFRYPDGKIAKNAWKRLGRI